MLIRLPWILLKNVPTKILDSIIEVMTLSKKWLAFSLLTFISLSTMHTSYKENPFARNRKDTNAECKDFYCI